MFINPINLQQGFSVLNDTTILLGRFEVINVMGWPDFDPTNHTDTLISMQSNRAMRDTFESYDESLAWCRSFRWGAKIEREFVQVNDPRTAGSYATTHECLVKLKFKNMSHAIHWKLRWQ